MVPPLPPRLQHVKVAAMEVQTRNEDIPGYGYGYIMDNLRYVIWMILVVHIRHSLYFVIQGILVIHIHRILCFVIQGLLVIQFHHILYFVMMVI